MIKNKMKKNKKNRYVKRNVQYNNIILLDR